MGVRGIYLSACLQFWVSCLKELSQWVSWVNWDRDCLFQWIYFQPWFIRGRSHIHHFSRENIRNYWSGIAQIKWRRGDTGITEEWLQEATTPLRSRETKGSVGIDWHVKGWRRGPKSWAPDVCRGAQATGVAVFHGRCWGWFWEWGKSANWTQPVPLDPTVPARPCRQTTEMGTSLLSPPTSQLPLVPPPTGRA